MKDVVELILRAERVTAICHENPDGDTLGAAIAIAIAAERLGKQAEVVSGDPPPPFLAVLPRIEQVRSAPALEPDLAVVVDTGDLQRTGRVAAEHGDWLSRSTVAVIDHHVSNRGFGTANWIDPEAAAIAGAIVAKAAGATAIDAAAVGNIRNTVRHKRNKQRAALPS